MRRWAELLLLAVVATYLVPEVAIHIPGFRAVTFFTTPILTGVAVGVFIRRTGRSIAVTLAVVLIPALGFVALDLFRVHRYLSSRHLSSFGLRATGGAVYLLLLLACALGGARIGGRPARGSAAAMVLE